MNQEKTLCCPECGSDDIAFEAWVDEHNNYLEDGGNYVVCGNSNCEVCNEEIRPILKSEFKSDLEQQIFSLRRKYETNGKG